MTGRTESRAAGRSGPGAPTWERLSDIPACIWYGPNRVRTTTTALVVGTALFLINHLDATLRGRATTGTWLETGASFLVPLVVANVGLLVATRDRSPNPPGPGPVAEGDPGSPTWAGLSEWPRCVLHRPHLFRTATIAAVVGSVYFLINQLGSALSGQASLSVWLASGFTYLVPFTVSNVGVLIGCRRRPSPSAASG